MLHGVEVRRLDAVDHGVELHALAQRGVCVAVYVAKKNPRRKKSSTPWIMAPSSTPQITASSLTPHITAPSCSIQVSTRRAVQSDLPTSSPCSQKECAGMSNFPCTVLIQRPLVDEHGSNAAAFRPLKEQTYEEFKC